MEIHKKRTYKCFCELPNTSVGVAYFKSVYKAIYLVFNLKTWIQSNKRTLKNRLMGAFMVCTEKKYTLKVSKMISKSIKKYTLMFLMKKVKDNSLFLKFSY